MVDILRDTQIPLPATYSPTAIERSIRDLVVSIEQLKFDGKTGHRHTGVAGDGALIAAGAVLQVQYTTDIVQRTLASATMAEVATQFRRSFTPISASSLLRLRATFTMNPSAQAQIIQFKFRDITNNVDVGTGTAVGSRTAVSTADRASSYDTNSPAIVVLDCIVSATNTTARIYSIYGKGEDGSTIYINQSALNSTTGWNAPFFFTIEEISTALTNPPSTKWTDLTGSQSAILVSGFNNDAGYLIDAPVDGTTYGRKNGSWSAASVSPMVYPGSGIPVSTGTAWTTSIVGTSSQFVKGDGSLDSSAYLASISGLNISSLTNDSGYLTSVAWGDLTGTPPDITTFNNNAGYITGYTETDPVFSAWIATNPSLPANGGHADSAGYADNAGSAGHAGSADSAGYADYAGSASAAENASHAYSADSADTAGSGWPTGVSGYTNDAGYLTSVAWGDIGGTPPNVSTFTNDVPYLVSGDLSGLVPYTGATTTVDLGANALTTTGDITGGHLQVNFPYATGGSVSMVNTWAGGGGVVAFDFLSSLIGGSTIVVANMAYIGEIEAGVGNAHFVCNYNPGDIPCDIGGTKIYLGYNNGNRAINDGVSMAQVNGSVNATDYLISGIGIGVSHWTNDSGYITSLSGAFLVDQTTPQTIVNGTPTFNLGLRSNAIIGVNLNTSTNYNSLTGTGVGIFGADNAVVRYGISSYGIAGVNAFAGRHARGTMASPTAVQSGDTIFSVEGWGYGATGYSSSPSAMVRGYATETWTDAHQGAEVRIWTTPTGAVVPAVSAYFNNNKTIRFPYYTTNGFVKFNNTNGTLDVDTNTYLTSLSGALLATGATTGATAQAQTFTQGVNLSNLTSGRIPYATTLGLLTDSANLTYNGITEIITGTAATDQPTLSAEFLLGTGWTSTGWTGGFATGWTHTSGNTTALTQSKAAVSTTKYQITYTISGGTTGTFTISFGGQTSAAVSASGAWGPTATSTASLSIAPSNLCDRTIVISIKSITAVSTPVMVFKTSDTTSRLEIRASNAATNNFIGNLAGGNLTTGTANNAFGASSLQKLTTGSNNCTVGGGALRELTTGSANTGVGAYAAFLITTGNDNVAIGNNALAGNISSNYNTAIGSSALSAATGMLNTAIGYYVLAGTTTGSYNSAIGVSAGRYLLDGAAANATGNNSLFLGYDTRANADGQTNQIVVGYSAIGKGSNTAVWGNTSIIGHYFSGNVGIGQASAPTARLHLPAGTATAGTAPIKLTSGVSLTAAEAGAIEFTTDDYFATITTGTARKAFVLDDGTRLTSGRIPFAGTNGRLTDDADLTFATDTLTATKIVGTTNISTPIVLTPQIKTDTTTPTDLTITTGAAKTLVLGTSVYDDLICPMISGKTGTSNVPTWQSFVGNLTAYGFAVDDYLESTAELLHSYKEGTALEIHIHWATNGLDVDARAVKWEVEYTIANENTGVFTTNTLLTGQTTIAANTADRTHLDTSMSATIAGTGRKIGDVILFRVRRIAATGGLSAPSANPFGLNLGIHYEKDTLGSRAIGVK